LDQYSGIVTVLLVSACCFSAVLVWHREGHQVGSISHYTTIPDVSISLFTPLRDPLLHGHNRLLACSRELNN